jgi:hypothetical protein
VKRIHNSVLSTAEEYSRPHDDVAGANIAGFLKVGDAMFDESPI